MNRTILWVLVLLFIVAGGWYFFATKTLESAPAPTTTGTPSSDTFATAAKALVGTWQSTDDPKFVREFGADGTASDYYAGQVTSTSTWQLYDAAHPLPVSFPLDATSTYIRMSDPSGPLDFKIVALAPSQLVLMYMGRGNILSFSREE